MRDHFRLVLSKAVIQETKINRRFMPLADSHNLRMSVCFGEANPHLNVVCPLLLPRARYSVGIRLQAIDDKQRCSIFSLGNLFQVQKFRVVQRLFIAI